MKCTYCPFSKLLLGSEDEFYYAAGEDYYCCYPELIGPYRLGHIGKELHIPDEWCPMLKHPGLALGEVFVMISKLEFGILDLSNELLKLTRRLDEAIAKISDGIRDSWNNA